MKKSCACKALRGHTFSPQEQMACLVHADEAQHLGDLGAQGLREVGHCHPGHAGAPWLPHERGAQRSE